MAKIALVQLGSFGDNINSTLMIEPIKQAYPKHELEVHVSSYYISAFANCPGIDAFIPHRAGSKTETFSLYNTVPGKVRDSGDYELVLVPAPILHPNEWKSLKHPELGYNLICSFVRELERHNIDYKLPLKTIMRLTEREIDMASQFAKSLPVNRRNILMEVEGESGQTFWNYHWTKAVGEHLLKQPTNLIVSRRHDGNDIVDLKRNCPQHSSVVWAGMLSLRECGELFNHCDSFFSVSSGLSNVCNTDHCKRDPNMCWIETVNSETVNSAPIHTIGKIFWYHNDTKRFIQKLKELGM